MSGTVAGGLKAKKKNIELYGKGFYKIIGSKGGQNGHTGGFAANPALAKVAGAKGGRTSRRTSEPAKKKEFIWQGGQGEELIFKDNDIAEAEKVLKEEDGRD